MDQPDVTLLLNAWRGGDEAAGTKLIEVVYQELRQLAAHYMQMERADHTLQPTALVHELYIKLFSTQSVEWQSRGHFLAVAARQLRHIVVDYARSQRAQKRGGGQVKSSVDLADEPRIVIDGRMVALDQALDRLATVDPRAAKVVELRYFGGLTDAEVASVLEISVPTVKRDWSFARSWLLKEVG